MVLSTDRGRPRVQRGRKKLPRRKPMAATSPYSGESERLPACRGLMGNKLLTVYGSLVGRLLAAAALISLSAVPLPAVAGSCAYASLGPGGPGGPGGAVAVAGSGDCWPTPTPTPPPSPEPPPKPSKPPKPPKPTPPPPPTPPAPPPPPSPRPSPPAPAPSVVPAPPAPVVRAPLRQPRPTPPPPAPKPPPKPPAPSPPPRPSPTPSATPTPSSVALPAYRKATRDQPRNGPSPFC